jgi:excisionase family DNA binding protein
MSTHLTEDSAGDWISQAEAARIRGVSRQAIGRLIRRHRLQTLKVAGRMLVRRKDIEQFSAQKAGRRAKG